MSTSNQTAVQTDATLTSVPETKWEKVVTSGVVEARAGYGKGQTKLAMEMLIMYHGITDKSLWIGSGQGSGAGEGFEQINGKMKSAIAGGEISATLVSSTWRAAITCDELIKGTKDKQAIVKINRSAKSITVDVKRLRAKVRNGLVISFHKTGNGKGNGKGKVTRAKKFKTLKSDVVTLLMASDKDDGRKLTKAERKDLVLLRDRINLSLSKYE